MFELDNNGEFVHMCRNVMNRAENLTYKPTVFLEKQDQLILGRHVEADVSFWILIAILFLITDLPL